MIFDFILHSDVQYDFLFYTALGRTVRFLREYYTRTYSMIFDLYCTRPCSMILNLCCTRTYSMVFKFILHSDVQHDFWLNTILGHIVWFLIYTALGHTVWFWIYTAFGRTVWFLNLYCTRTYNMIFDWILYSDVQYDFWQNITLRRIVRFLTLYCTRTYSMIWEYTALVRTL